jgi:DNA-directed RNA polymerase specialized sigma24 family protein
MAENYIDNERFHQLILEYHERKKTNPKERIPEEAGKMIILMAKRLATRYVFNNYTFKEEFVNDAILRAVEIFDNYDPIKYDKPFAYFTLVMWRTFLQRIQKEKQERTKREKLVMVDDIFSLQEGDDCHVSRDSLIQDYIFNSYDE